MGEVRADLEAGVPLKGVCLDPVMDYPGWQDDRHCRCGLLAAPDDWRTQTLDSALLRQVQEEVLLLRHALATENAAEADPNS